jgi:hypothetical protein
MVCSRKKASNSTTASHSRGKGAGITVIPDNVLVPAAVVIVVVLQVSRVAAVILAFIKRNFFVTASY